MYKNYYKLSIIPISFYIYININLNKCIFCSIICMNYKNKCLDCLKDNMKK